ncbi:ATP-binding protein [Marinimicrobium sp. C2-29]|uniref:ATP-binding protein n=1 Tax=Marinimicrobium sp. C2-29 TaxID=3139825 RepID=UPI0031390ADC
MILRWSLRWRLMAVICLSLAGLWLLLAPWMLFSVKAEMERTLDDRLAASARMVASLVNRHELPTSGDPGAATPGADAQSLAPSPQASQMLDKAIANPEFPASLACRVSTRRGEILAQSQDAPTQALDNSAEGYSNREVDGQRWRVYTATIDGLRITTADRLSTRDELMTSVIVAAVVPFIAALAGTLVLVGFGIERSLRPLQKLSHSVAGRSVDSAEPLQWRGGPTEVEPLVDEINRLMIRVQQAMRRERRFTGDAAHELRTPLTAIKTQLHVARLTPGEPAERALQQAERAVDKLQSTLEQLLLLARLDGNAAFEDVGCTTADEISSDAIRDVTARARANDVHVKYQTHCAEEVAVPAALAVTALRNLLENAVRFSPEGETVLMTTETEGQYCVWTVLDKGPGVAQDKLSELTQRFVHLEPNGNGLGLAIVETIARRFGGSLELTNTAEGLQATLRLPLKDAT